MEDEDLLDDMDSPEDEIVEIPSTDVDQEEELTDEQKKLAEELSLPISNPELMVVVPRAFSLDEYLNQKESGEVVEDVTSTDLKYFIIGGSFIVSNNADRFHAGLEEQGYETRILFHPESRFNFVAYQGFATFDEAVTYLRSIRANTNSEAWLFTKPTN